MTAVFGFLDFTARNQLASSPSAGQVRRLLDLYGPHGNRSWSDERVFFSRSLFRTTPEDFSDRQPYVCPESGNVTLFDGRIDNRESVARGLGIASERLQQCSDAELASLALNRWASGAFGKLIGDFAVAYWLLGKKTLLLARDPLGFRPLFWWRDGGRFAFASLPKMLFCLDGVPRKVREESLHDWLCMMPMEQGATLYESIQKVEPGHFLEVRDGAVAAHRYHSFAAVRPLKLARPEDYVDGLREVLSEAVNCRLRSLGPVGSELSSGFDSSTITALAAIELARQGKDLLAFTGAPPISTKGQVVPSGYHRDEVPGASALAARYSNIRHFVVPGTFRSPLERLEEQVDLSDRPVLNPSNINWIGDVRRQAQKQGVTTLLNGWQGNLSISHDGRCLLQQLIARGRLFSWWRNVGAMKKHFPRVPRKWFLEFSVAPLVPDFLWDWYSKRQNSTLRLERYSPLSAEAVRKWKSQRRARSRGLDLFHRGSGNAFRFRVLPLYRLEFAENVLALNAEGIDPRSPTLDTRVIEYCLSVPESIFLKDGQPQWLIKALGRGLLPTEITECRTRGYQGSGWMEELVAAKDDLAAELEAMAQHPSISKLVDIPAMRDLVASLAEGESGLTAEAETLFRNKMLRGFSAGAFVRNVEPDNH